MFDTPFIISRELVRLVDEYYKCTDFNIKEQLQCDIQLLSEAMVLCELLE